MVSPNNQLLKSAFLQINLIPHFSSSHIQSISKSCWFTCSIYFESIHFSSPLLTFYSMDLPFLWFYSHLLPISTSCRDQNDLLQSKNGHFNCHSPDLKHWTLLPSIDSRSQTSTMIYRILCSVALPNSSNYLTASPLYQAHELSLGFSFHFLLASTLYQFSCL